MAAKKDAHLKEIARKLIAGELEPQDTVEIRGFWKGCDWLFAQPDRAVSALEHELKRLEANG